MLSHTAPAYQRDWPLFPELMEVVEEGLVHVCTPEGHLDEAGSSLAHLLPVMAA